jgi:D-alanyl-D-alanine dipeptidase
MKFRLATNGIAYPQGNNPLFRPMYFHRAIIGLRCYLALAFFSVIFASSAQQSATQGATKTAEAWASEPMVDLARACSTIFIELRYASRRNLTGKPIYPVNARCYVRQSVAFRLLRAQDYLQEKGFRLKIWDGYRPDWAQRALWHAAPNPDFLQPPSQEASMHTRGVAVDATLVTLDGHELQMPTDFDDFTPAAHMKYTGGDPVVARHLRILQIAMGRAGFLGNQAEWWHFVARDFENCKPLDLDIQPQRERNDRLTARTKRDSRG